MQKHTIKTTSDGFECTCGQSWAVLRGDGVSAELVTEAASMANRHADEANGLDDKYRADEAKYRADRRANQRAEFQPMMLALIAGAIAARTEKKPKKVVEEALEIVNAIWEACP